MESLLYAEVYLICMIVLGLLLFWTIKSSSDSVTERWLRSVLISFLVNFTANFCFTLVNGGPILGRIRLPGAYFFKTLYHISLCVGVFAWCGYAETELHSGIFQRKSTLRLLLIPLAVPILLDLLNLWTHWLFRIDASGTYRRQWLFQAQMIYLALCSGLCSVRLLRRGHFESDPIRKAHLRLTASFPLCLVAAWLLSYIGESVPVICVSIMVELLSLFVGSTHQQVSQDKLTQVNNRQNLFGFLDFKLRNHGGRLFLLMVDVDYFKSINDTYGHLEGDAALVRVASALKKACGPFRLRPYIARYGGDEFIIVLEAAGASEVDELCRSIREELQAVSENKGRYELKVSIGVSEWREGMNAKELIAAADTELYKIKHARHP